MVVMSLLGEKPDGRSEFSFYSFYDRDQSFQHWLDQNYGERAIEVIEHQTCDLAPVPNQTLVEVGSNISKLLLEGRTVILVDSGGCTRTGQVCKYIGATEIKPGVAAGF